MLRSLVWPSLVCSLALGCVVASGAATPVTAAPTPPATPPGYDLLDPARRGASIRRGAQGPAVSALQRALGRAGFPVDVDGVFGGQTWTAVRALQARHGCFVDGVVGPETMRAFDRVFGLSGGSTAPGPAPAPTPGPGPTPAPPAPGPVAAGVPPRPAGAPAGSAFFQATAGLSRPAREDALRRELVAGNVPDFLRRTVAVSWSAVLADGRAHTITVRALPDYLALGHDGDFVRTPVGGPTAQAVADAWGMVLPTRRVVDRLWQQAAVRLAPSPMAPSAQMMSNAYFVEHQRRVEAQRAGRPLGLLTAGHKKDVVLTPRHATQPGRVAIYGWHQLDGRPIQPLSLVHEATYADYSHGVRLLDAWCEVDGRAARVADVLADPLLHPLLSDEGRLASARLP